jgi:redox-sensitive bicupin YhaK (pirin superfamily)
MDLDPFLLLDTFRSDNPDDYLAGFPEHPHRGFGDAEQHDGILAGFQLWINVAETHKDDGSGLPGA